MSEPQLNEQGGAQQPEVSVESAQPVIGPGAQLAIQRQARGWSVDQVADQLNLAARQIQALEIDNYAALPGIVIARGFIRAYAKLLKVDPTPLVAMMPGEIVQMESLQLKRALSGSFSESRLPPMGGNGWLSKWIIVSFFLALTLLAILTAQWAGWLPGFSDSVSEKFEKGVTLFSAPAPDALPSTGETVAPASPVTNSTGGMSQGLSTSTGDKIASPDSPSQSAVSRDVIAKPMPTNEAVVVAPGTSANMPAPVTPPVPGISTLMNRNILVIKVRDDSWVEVKGADDSILISRLLKAGSTEMLSIAQPIFLTVGNAAGVDVTLRGNVVDLKTSAKNNIVRLSLK